MLAVSPAGAPFVAYLHGNSLEVAARRRSGAWTRQRAAHVTRGSTLVAFKASRRGPVVLVRGAGSHSLDLVPPDESRMAEDSYRARSERLEARLAGARAAARERDGGVHPWRAPRTRRPSCSCGSTSAAARTPCRSRERLPEELRRATGRAGARGPHGSRDRVVRHRRSGRDDRVASAERHLEGPVHRRRQRRLPGRAAPRSGRWQRGVRGMDAGAPRRGRAARVARETRAVDRERLRARSRDHDRLRA